MKTLLGDFNANVGKENIFKPTIGQESLLNDISDNGVRIVTSPHQTSWLLRARFSTPEQTEIHLDLP